MELHSERERPRSQNAWSLMRFGNIAPPNAIPSELALVTQTGRKRSLGLLVNTQLPNKLNGSILNEVSEFVCFRCNRTRRWRRRRNTVSTWTK